MKKWMSISSILSLVMVWYVVYLVVDHPILMPSIEDTFFALIRLFGSRDAVLAMAHTFVRLGICIGISLLLALILAYVSYQFEAIESFLHPYMVLFKTIPLVSVILILYVLVNFNLTTYIITGLMIFPLFYQAILTGLKLIDPSYLDIYRLEAMNVIGGIKYVYYPLIRSYIVLGLLQSLGLGLKVIVMAEFITQYEEGIGRLIYNARVNLEYDRIFAITLLLIIITLGIENIIKRIHTLSQNK